jgi:hypothetical protein
MILPINGDPIQNPKSRLFLRSSCRSDNRRPGFLRFGIPCRFGRAWQLND